MVHSRSRRARIPEVSSTRNDQEAPAMAGSMTEIPVNGDAVPAYISLPPSGSGPAVVVIQEWWGLVPHIRNVADRLAAQGFVAVAPDLYRGKETTEPDEAGKLVMELQLEPGGQGHGGRGRHPAGHAGDHRPGGRRGRLLRRGRAGPVPGLAQARGHGRGLLLRLPPRRHGLGPVGGQGGRARALRRAGRLRPPGAGRAHRGRAARRRRRRHLPPLPGHHPRLLQRRPARGPRRRGGRHLLAAVARVPPRAISARRPERVDGRVC